MFGRVRRSSAAIAGGRPVIAYGVLLAYNPMTIAGITAAGMGAAAYGGAGMVHTRDGLKSAAGESVNAVLDWGRREQRRFVRLPNRVLAVVTDEQVVLTPWYATARDRRPVATWRGGSFSAVATNYIGQRAVRVTVSGSAAILATRGGPWHRRARATIDAIVRSGS